MEIKKEASVFYFTYALLLASRHYLQYLIESKSVSQGLKRDFKIIINRITDLDKTANRSLDDKEANTWRKEWTEKDYEVFASVFSKMNDMDEEKRLMLEEFADQLMRGEIKVEAQRNTDERSVANQAQ